MQQNYRNHTINIILLDDKYHINIEGPYYNAKGKSNDIPYTFLIEKQIDNAILTSENTTTQS